MPLNLFESNGENGQSEINGYVTEEEEGKGEEEEEEPKCKLFFMHSQLWIRIIFANRLNQPTRFIR